MMNKMLFSSILLFSLSATVFAGGVKDLLIETDEAIESKFYDEGKRVDIIENHKFASTASGVGVEADVETTSLSTKKSESWSCLVSFTKSGTRYVPYDVNCN